MSHIFPRHSRISLKTAVQGKGVYLFDNNGKQYIDASGGAAVSCLGHGDAHVRRAIHDQIDRLEFAHTSFFTSEPAEKLADKLIEHAPKGPDRVYLVSGGSEAVETALKLARQYFLEIGQPQRRHIIARRQSFHGNTLGALATGGNMSRRAAFGPLLIDTHHIDPCYEYRGRRSDETAYDYGQRVANELENQIVSLGGDTVIAFIAETVVGATAGVVPPVEGYFKRVREICDKYGVLLILDEVMCGMGRTGTLFACEQDGVSPDIITIAKGLGAGYQPIGATLCTAAIHDQIAAGSGFFHHGHTYIGHPVASAAAVAVLERLIDDNLIGKAREMGVVFDGLLKEKFSQHPNIGDIRGRGMFRGLELVEDREKKTPFDASLKLHAKIKAAALEMGLVCYPGGGTVDGVLGDHILLAPPFISEANHLEEIVEKLHKSIEAAI